MPVPAPFIWSCSEEAKTRGATVLLLTFNPAHRINCLPDNVIAPDTGPELLTGSTRLKAGAAAKLILNILTTLAMTHSGKAMSNRMIDLHPSKDKCKRPKFDPLSIRRWPNILAGMSKPRTTRRVSLTCTDVRFVQVEFPRQIQPRLVIEFSDGLSLLLENQAGIPLAAEFIGSFRKHLAAKGGRPC